MTTTAKPQNQKTTKQNVEETFWVSLKQVAKGLINSNRLLVYLFVCDFFCLFVCVRVCLRVFVCAVAFLKAMSSSR